MIESELTPAALTLDHSADLTPEQSDTELFGFWLFLMSDAVVFALLFATYGVMLPATAGGPTPGYEYRMLAAFLESLMLLTSSFTYGMASVAMKHGGTQRLVRGWLLFTLILGMAFLGMEVHDFAGMLREGASPTRSGYLSSFFALVSLHGLHVLVGCLWIVVMIIESLVLGFDVRVRLNIVRLGLFWHFLDIVWIAIFSVVYLQGLIA